MKSILSKLLDRHTLTAEESARAFELIMRGEASAAQVGAMLSLLAARADGPTAEELVGAARVLRSRAEHVQVPAGLKVIDTCGTGGSGSRLFNVSTAAGLVAAAAGRPHGVAVAKHGNRSVTSTSGSSQVLEVLGVKLHVRGETLTRCLDETGFCFCFAPLHHPALKMVAPIRNELGFRTIFNLVAPLVNPAGATRQVLGVSTVALTRTMVQVLRELGAEHAMVVHGSLGDGPVHGVGELTTTGPSHVAHLRAADGPATAIQEYTVDPRSVGFTIASYNDLTVDSPTASAAVIRRVLSEKDTASPQRDLVVLNAAAALLIADLAVSLDEGIALANDAIRTGAAADVLDKIVRITTSDQS